MEPPSRGTPSVVQGSAPIVRTPVLIMSIKTDYFKIGIIMNICPSLQVFLAVHLSLTLSVRLCLYFSLFPLYPCLSVYLSVCLSLHREMLFYQSQLELIMIAESWRRLYFSVCGFLFPFLIHCFLSPLSVSC